MWVISRRANGNYHDISKTWLAHGYLPQQGRAASLMSRSVHSGMAVEAGEIEPSHVLSPINFFVWTLSGVKVQRYTNRDAIPKRSVFHSTH
jgi:hypothetical protein